MQDSANPSNEALALARSVRFTTSSSGDRLLVAGESEAHIFDGRIYVDIATALSPSVSWEEMRGRLSARYQLAEIQAALVALAKVGYVRPLRDSIDRGCAAWWEALGAEPAPRCVSLEWLCPAGQQMIQEALASCDIAVSSGADLRLVLTDDYLRPELGDINRQGRCWLPAKAIGYKLWLGPLFRPGQSPCWECLAWWLRMHRWQQWAFHGWRDGNYPPQPSVANLPATFAIAAGMIATATASVLAAGEQPKFAGALLTFDTTTLRQILHEVRPIPGCPVCGGRQPASPLALRSFTSDVAGVVTQMDVSSRPVAGLFHAHGDFVHALPAVRTTAIMRPGEAYGKGTNAEAAETACVAEALERYSLAWRGDEPIIRASLGAIDAIAPNTIAQYSEAQLATRTVQECGENSMFWIPAPLDPKTEVGWVECQRVGEGPARYVPAAGVYFAYPFETAEPYVIADSNGCAAGRNHEEALANALFELIERDALAIWWYNRVRRPSVPLPEMKDEAIEEIVTGLQKEGRVPEVLEITTDLKLPAYVALAPKADGSEVVFGAAAHVCPQRALYKALAEVSQIAYWKDRVSPNPELAEWLRVANTQKPEFEWLMPLGTASLPARRLATPTQSIEACAENLTRAGIEAYWIEVTRREIGLPVVRAIAPGLRNPWARFAPGRLYDTPVRLGWRSRPAEESSLNPIHCML